MEANTDSPLRAGRMLQYLGTLLLVVGAVVGWLLPVLFSSLSTPVAVLHLDVSGYLGADITALAVIIAVIVGFNASALQISGQAQALTVIRGILLSMVPFFLLWGVTTCVALVYFLQPPVYITQLWQVLIWFVATVVMMVGYTFEVPWLVSGSYFTLKVIRQLRGKPLDRWEALDGYSALITAIGVANERGDLGMLRATTTHLSAFLCGRLDPRAEQERGYRRERYRALKNLLSGCAQSSGSGPNAVAYHLGYVTAGVLLQGSAIGVPIADPERDFFSGLSRGLRGTPERLDPLWTGVRHALCRRVAGGPPYLLRYWEAHRIWSADDPRLVADVAGALAQLHAVARKQMALLSDGVSSLNDDAATMLADLYRDITLYLAREVSELRRARQREQMLARCASLLDAVHAQAVERWELPAEDTTRATIIRAYEERLEELRALIALEEKR